MEMVRIHKYLNGLSLLMLNLIQPKAIYVIWFVATFEGLGPVA